MSLVQHFTVYSHWRSLLIEVLADFARWLNDQGLNLDEAEARLPPLLARLQSDRLRVAFVAEFSRGKSELINSLFFADYGCRILPTSAGRTTMCPTELFHDPQQAPFIALLPVETRLENKSFADFLATPKAWLYTPLDIHSPASLQTAINQVTNVCRVTPEEALRLGFSPVDPVERLRLHGEKSMEIPRWRHALINFPHPLLQQGLVILDTPGLNAIGAEPELTLSLLPQAHAILFLLAADAGVTQSDLAVWQSHIGPHRNRQSRIVALNKIDSLWDPLKSDAELEAEIARQTRTCAELLHIDSSQIFPVSAHKGLLAKIQHDPELLAQSRLPQLEAMLSRRLIPAKLEIVRDDVETVFKQVYHHTRAQLETRLDGIRRNMDELTRLNGKNRDILDLALRKARTEKQAFALGFGRFQATQRILGRLADRLYAQLGANALAALMHATAETMRMGIFSKQLSNAMARFFVDLAQTTAVCDGIVDEIHAMMAVAYDTLNAEYDLRLPPLPPFSLKRHRQELKRLDIWTQTHVNTLTTLLTLEKKQLTRKFFNEVGQQVEQLFERTTQEVKNWLVSLWSPLATQMEERQSQLKNRLETVHRVLDAGGSLNERLRELEHSAQELRTSLRQLDNLKRHIDRILHHAVTARVQGRVHARPKGDAEHARAVLRDPAATNAPCADAAPPHDILAA